MSNKKPQTVVPKLRFPEFRDAESWEEENLEKLYSFKSTNSLSRDKLTLDKGTVKNVHYGDIHTKFSSHFDIEKEEVPYIIESESLEKIKSESFCKEGDVIFADASEDMADIGKCIEIVNLKNEKLLSGLHTILARQKKDLLIIGFAGHLFQSRRLRKKIQNEAQGAKVIGISGGRLAGIDVCFPKDKKEQKKIADCLSSVDELIALEGQKLEELQDHKKGLMQELFPASGEALSKRRFPEFKDAPEWNVSTVEEISSVSSGGTPSRTKIEYWNGNIPWISTTLIDSRIIYEANESITKAGLENSSTKIFPRNTILMAMYGQGKTRGKVAVMGIDAAINQACAAIQVKPGMNIEFVFQNLAARYEEIRDISNSGGQKNLSSQLIKKIPFSYPDIKSQEQQRIADCLSSLDILITSQAQKVESLQEHKKGLMQQLFPSTEEVMG